MNRLLIVAGLVSALLPAGCGRHKPKPAMPPLQVETARAVTDSIPNRMSFIGYLSSNFDAVIQPRINGFLLSKQYANGMPVKRGQLLFTIDPDQLSTTMLAAEAALQSAKAQALEARNNYVRSPIDGIIEHTAAHVGDYVGPGTQFSVLTSISNIDTLTVDVAIPMAEYLRAAGGRSSIYDNEGLLSDIRLTLADGTRYPYGGLYDYTRKDVSSSTGTLVLVVMFPNPDRSLKPGQFARVSANVGPVQPRVIVPQQSVSQAQGVNSVWVVRPDSTAAYRRVVLGDTYGTMWCVDEGLAEGEQVVTAGQQKLRDGMKVIPVKR